MRPIVALIAAVCALAAVLNADPVQAQTSEQPASPAEEACTWESARPVTIEQLTANFREMAGDCVRLTALHARGMYLTDPALLSSREALLEQDEPGQHSLSVGYASGPEHASHRPRWEEVLGHFQSCTLAYEWIEARMRATDNIIMLRGLCHYTLDHYIAPLDWRDAQGRPVARLRASEVEPALRQLLPEDVTEQIDAPGRVALRQLFAVLEEGDFSAWLRLSAPDLSADLEEKGEDGLSEGQRETLSEERGQFAADLETFARTQAARSGRVFLMRWQDSEDASVEEDDQDHLFCLLPTGVDEDELPVLSIDATNDPARPYLCVETASWTTYGSPSQRETASMPYFQWGLPESAE